MVKSRSCDQCARKRILNERGHYCEVCGYDGSLFLHHTIPVSDGGHSNVGGDHLLQLLCEKCHADAHGYKKRKYLDKRREHWVPKER